MKHSFFPARRVLESEPIGLQVLVADESLHSSHLESLTDARAARQPGTSRLMSDMELGARDCDGLQKLSTMVCVEGIQHQCDFGCVIGIGMVALVVLASLLWLKSSCCEHVYGDGDRE